jgi:hypothetical protein
MKQTEKEVNMTTSNKPIHRIKSGAVSLAVWQNSGENGVYHTMTLERSYRDGETWKSASSLRRSDLPNVVWVAMRAATFLESLTSESTNSSADADDEELAA